jgi:hypothetical protein
MKKPGACAPGQVRTRVVRGYSEPEMSSSSREPRFRSDSRFELPDGDPDVLPDGLLPRLPEVDPMLPEPMLPELPLPEPPIPLSRSMPDEPGRSCPCEPIRPCPCELEDPVLPGVEPMLPELELRLRFCSSKSLLLPWLDPLPLPMFLLSAIEPSAFLSWRSAERCAAVRVATAPADPVSRPDGRLMTDVPEGGKHHSLT